MALLSVIRRWHFRQGMPIREIERRTGLSRNTIRKYLRAGTVEPLSKVPERPSKLDPFAEKPSGWLRVEPLAPPLDHLNPAPADPRTEPFCATSAGANTRGA